MFEHFTFPVVNNYRVERALVVASMEALYFILDYKRIVLSKIVQEKCSFTINFIFLHLQIFGWALAIYECDVTFSNFETS